MFNEQPKEMLTVTNESNHSAVARTSIHKDMEISITSKNMRRNDVIKSISETSTVEIKNINVPGSPLHNWNMIFEKHITDNRVTRKSAKTKDSLMPEIRLNNSIVETTSRVKKKSYVHVARSVKPTPSPKVSVNF